MEKEYLHDYLISRVMSQGKMVDGYSRIYSKSNENLVEQYKLADFKDKDVLTVLASSDQLLSAYYYGANLVDTFDINRLTIYYYYLRRWSIIYNHELYPNIYNLEHLTNLVNKVIPTTEQEQIAKEYYQNLLATDSNIYMLFFTNHVQPKGRLPYKTSEEIAEFMKKDLNFHQYNMFEPQDIEKKYDIVVLSNIMDWARGNSGFISNTCNNLVRITKPSSIILCSNLTSREDIPIEHEIFSDDFELVQSKYSKNYMYIRK